MSDELYKDLKSQLSRIESLTLLTQKKALTIDECAIYTGLKKSQLYKLTMNQLIPFSKPRGKEIYFDRELVDEWLLRNPISTKEDIESRATTYTTLNKSTQ